MKYGARLDSFSVPEWRTHNILYDDLKLEIKELTESSTSFSPRGYQHLLASFEEELQSVNLFVRCKLGEIEFRFQQCRESLSAPGGPDWQRAKDVQRLNMEIFNLSRYISAQYTGFRKLVKKYCRHAPESALANGYDLRSVQKQLESGFASVDLKEQFTELSRLYLQLRRSAHAKQQNFFGALLAQPLIARFWVHHDNAVQLKVLLLQHLDVIAERDVSICYIKTAQNDIAELYGDEDGWRLCVPSGMRFISSPLAADQADQLVAGKVPSEDGSAPLKWLRDRKIKSVVTLQAQSSQFSYGGVYAALYSDVRVTSSDDATSFPHSILVIRAGAEPSWLAEFRKSHLVHPAPHSFSLAKWALLTTDPQQERPSWFDDVYTAEVLRAPEVESRPQPQQQPPRRRASANNTTTEPNGNAESTTESNADRPQFRYWNEFDDEVEDEEHVFLDEIDEELRRARMAARLAQPVYQLGASVRRKLHIWFDPGEEEEELESSSASVSSRESASGEIGGRFSPRVARNRRHSGLAEDLEARLLQLQSGKAVLARSHSDAALGIVTFLCLFLSLVIVALVFAILLTEDTDMLALGIRVALVLFMITALALALLGYTASNFRSEAGWLSQASVHTTLLCVVCLGVGGIVNILSPDVVATATAAVMAR